MAITQNVILATEVALLPEQEKACLKEYFRQAETLFVAEFRRGRGWLIDSSQGGFSFAINCSIKIVKGKRALEIECNSQPAAITFNGLKSRPGVIQIPTLKQDVE